jgi:hypothetical protein
LLRRREKCERADIFTGGTTAATDKKTGSNEPNFSVAPSNLEELPLQLVLPSKLASFEAVFWFLEGLPRRSPISSLAAPSNLEEMPLQQDEESSQNSDYFIDPNERRTEAKMVHRPTSRNYRCKTNGSR